MSRGKGSLMLNDYPFIFTLRIISYKGIVIVTDILNYHSEIALT